MGIAELINQQMQTAGQPREIQQVTTLDPGGSNIPNLSSIGMLILSLLDMEKQSKRMDEFFRLMTGNMGGMGGAQPIGFGSFDMNQMNPMDLFRTFNQG